MRRSSLPQTGPLRIDCRQMAPTAAVRRVEDLLKRTRGGPRLLRVITDEREVVEALVSWSRLGGARTELSDAPGRFDVWMYLLPVDFDGHPLVAWRPSARPLDATPDGLHVSI
jgi:hypothetical protein